MIFVFVAVYSGGGGFWTAVIAAWVVAGMGLAGDKMFKGGIKVWDVHIPGPEPDPNKPERERREKATAIMGTEYCEAMVLPHNETKELYLWVFRGTKPSARALPACRSPASRPSSSARRKNGS